MKKKQRGLTLIELMIAIGISTILGVTVVLMLRTSMDAYFYAEKEVLIQKIINETLNEISGDSFISYGIKDALEVKEAREDAFSFVPLWSDDSHSPGSKKRFILNRPFKAGAAVPIAESESPRGGKKFVPLSFIPDPDPSGRGFNDTVILNEPVDSNAVLRFIYHPDSKNFDDVIVKIKWSQKENCFVRGYKNKKNKIPFESFKNIKLKGSRFQYFDNTNTEIRSPVPEELLSNISAVRVTLYIEEEKDKTRQSSMFINLRNSRSYGKGIIIREGTRVKIPDSRVIRTFCLGNIVGVKKGDVIQLRADSSQGRAWRAIVLLGYKNGSGFIEKVLIEYPPGVTVYSETVNQTLQLPLNFLTCGRNGRFDYDFDKEIDNAVVLEGEVFLTVERMEPVGAALFIRP